MKKNKNKKCRPHPKAGLPRGKAGAAEIKTSLGVMIVLLFFVGILGWLMSAL